jgi:protocatechuate 3,4-dioxygenase beta subunit
MRSLALALLAAIAGCLLLFILSRGPDGSPPLPRSDDSSPPASAPAPPLAEDKDPVRESLRLREITGVVTDARTAAPISGAQVRAVNWLAEGDIPTVARDTTGHEGAFRLGPVRGGRRLSLRVRREGYAEHFRWGASPGAHLEVRLRPGGALEGRVLALESGEPVPGAVLTLDAHMWNWMGIARTSEDGRFLISGLPESVFSVTIRSAEHPKVSIWEVRVRAGEATRREFLLPEGARIAGRVLVEGRPCAGAGVRSRDRLKRCVTGPEGSFELHGFGAGRQQLYVEAAGRPEQRFIIAVDAVDDLVEADLPVEDLPWIAGRVVHEGRPVPGAEVRWSGRDRVLTDPDGRFRIRPPFEPWSKLGARAEGLGAVEVNVRRPAPGSGPPPLVIQLSTAARVRGLVSDQDGHPVAGARIHTLPGGYGSLWAGTGTDGRYEILLPAPGRVEITASAVGFERSRERRPIDLEPGQVLGDADFSLVRRTGFVEGRVVDEEGRPIPGALVSGPGPDVWADAEGRFRLEGLSGEREELYAFAPGFLETQEEGVTVDIGSTDIVLSLTRGCTITGRVTTHTGEPVPVGEVRLHHEETENGFEVALNDRHGRFRCAGLFPGRYLLSAHAGSLVSRIETVEVASGAPAEVALALEVGGALLGRVLDSKGEPVGEAVVQAHRTDEDRWVAPERRARSNSSGWFAFRDLPGGEYRLDARKEGFGCILPVKTTVLARLEQRADVHLVRRGALEITVLDPAEAPIAGALVRVQSRWISGASETTGEDGIARMESLVPAEAKVFVQCQGFRPVTVPVRIPVGSTCEAKVSLEPERR